MIDRDRKTIHSSNTLKSMSDIFKNRSAWSYYLQYYHPVDRYLVFGFILSIAQSFIIIPIAMLIQLIFDGIMPSGNFLYLVLAGLAVIILYMTDGGTGLWTRKIFLEKSKFIIQQVRDQLVQKCFAFSRSYYSQQDLAKLHTHIVQDTERVDVMTNAILVQLIPCLCGSLVLIALLAILNTLLFLILILLIPLVVWISGLINKKVKLKVHQFHRSFEMFSKGIWSVLSRMDLTRIQSAEQFERERQRENLDHLRNVSGRMAWLRAAYTSVQGTMVAITSIVILIAGGKTISSGMMTLGELIAFYAVFSLLRSRLMIISSVIPSVIEGNESLKSLHTLLKADAERPYTGTRKIKFQGKIMLDSIFFQYNESPVLKNISLIIEPGKTTAIIGPNGSGKTTIANLILGFYAPQKGCLYADDTPYIELKISELRRYMGVVTQNPILFSGTIAENISYGMQEKQSDQIIHASQLALAHEFISAFPDGYQTIIGEGGALISGGQRQRIAIARALLRNPELFILDEPTNHLDATAVSTVMNNLKTIRKSPTIVIISHNIEIAKDADQIIVIEDGQIIADRRDQIDFP